MSDCTRRQARMLGDDIDHALHIIEADRIGCTRGARGSSNEVRHALALVARRTANAICMRRPVVDNEKPGVDIALAMGGTRTGRADTLAGRIQLWLESEDSQNLRESLHNEHDTERHAVLVFDPHTEPEYQAAVEQELAFLPAIRLELPDAVDVLWFILGPIACAYSLTTGWRTMMMPDARPDG